MTAPLAIAHRAGNSIDRLHVATSLGADVVEADIHHHRGALEVRHLKTMGPVPLLWDKWQLVSARAPRLPLAELLRAADEGATFMLDLKGRRAGVGVAVAELLHAEAPERPVVVCSRHWGALEPFVPLPWVRRVLSARNRRELARLRAVVAAAGAYGVSVHRSLLDADFVAELHRSVEVVMTWPINDEAALAEVIGKGVTGIITDSDDVLGRVLAQR